MMRTEDQSQATENIRTFKLFSRLTLYYLAIFVVVTIFVRNFPEAARHLPLEGIESLLSQERPGVLDPIEIHATEIDTRAEGLAWLLFSIMASVAMMIPVSWVYMAVRDRSAVDQALVSTMIVLPIAVTGIVLVVHNSLALAFSLAGIVAGVRFRNTLKSSGDALFIFLAVGVGLASGIGMLMVAAVMSFLFNYTFLTLWTLDYGEIRTGKRYMRRSKFDEEDEAEESSAEAEAEPEAESEPDSQAQPEAEPVTEGTESSPTDKVNQ